MAKHKNGGFGGNGQGGNADVLKFLGALVKGQAKIAGELVLLRHDHNRLAREVVSMRSDFNRGFRTLFKIAMDSHKDIQGLKSDVSDLKGRMTRVEKRLDGNGHPPARPGPNGR